MAWAVKYQCEFTDINGVDWSVYISEDGYEGAIIPMIPAGNPLTIEWLTPGDDILANPIKGSVATLNVECTVNFEYIGLYDEEDLVRLFSVTKNEELYWSGYVSNDYSEPYDNVPYTVSITAADGLGLLKNIPYLNAGAAYTGRVTADAIIKIVLGKIGITDYDEYLNIYEDRMLSSASRSVLKQTYIDNDLFIDKDCYTVLNSILLSFNAIIRQKDGYMVIYRPTELINDTVWGRAMGTVITPKQLLPNKVIDRTAGDLTDFEGGVLMYKPPMNTFTAIQDYGNRESWIKNHKLTATSFIPATGFTGWTRSYATMPLSYEARLRNEKEGVYFPIGDMAGEMEQTFGVLAKTAANAFILSFDYMLINNGVIPYSNVEARLTIWDTATTYYLGNNGSEDTATWSASVKAIKINHATVPVGVGEWISARFSIASLPADGSYVIRLIPTLFEYVGIAFKNIRFYATSDEVVVKTQKVSRWKEWVNMIPPFGFIHLFGGGYKKVDVTTINDLEEVVERRYVADNDINGETAEQKYIIGDVADTDIVNVLEQYAGALAIDDTDPTPTTTWHTRGNTETLPLLQITTNEIAALYSRGRHFLQLNLYELSEDLNIIGNLQDPLNVVGAQRRVFVFNRGTLNCQAREWTADFIEIGLK